MTEPSKLEEQRDSLLCDILDLCCVDTDHSKGVQLIGSNFDKALALIKHAEEQAELRGRRDELDQVKSANKDGLIYKYGKYAEDNITLEDRLAELDRLKEKQGE